MSEQNQRCENCYYSTEFIPPPKSLLVGETPVFVCQLKSPTVNRFGDTEFPLVLKANWCGEWKEKKENQ